MNVSTKAKKRAFKIYIDSACEINYASFYIQGLRDVFGSNAIRFRSSYFKQFKYSSHFFCFVIFDGTQHFKIAVDFADGTAIDRAAYDWADVYAKINIAFEDISTFKKLLSIGPGFGVKIFSKPVTFFHACINLVRSVNRLTGVKKFLSAYNAQLKRAEIGDYDSSFKSDNSYIFFLSSLWKKELVTNNFRANFIRAARNNHAIDFEGGFAPRRLGVVPGYEDVTCSRRYSLNEYLEKTKKSAIVFNTPAVLHCHGWKLGEFLALGKAIVSTPISRCLPFPLENGKHFLETDGSLEDIEIKMERILGEEGMKEKLEFEAKKYYLDFLAPEKVIQQIMSKMYAI